MIRSTSFIKNITLFLLSFFAFYTLPGCAAVKSPEEQRQAATQGINQALTSIAPRTKVGIVVQSMKTGEILYQKNANHPFVPGSNIKLFTALTALDKLGPEFRFQTQLLTDAPALQDGVMQGNLYVKFSGDPDLEVEDLEQLVTSLSQSGVRTIQGNIIVDNNNYDNTGIAPGTSREDPHYCYAAPVNAIILNRNCANLRVIPATQGRIAQLEYLQPLPIPIRNNIWTTRFKRRRCSIHYTQNHQGSTLTGCVKSNQPVEVSVPFTASQNYIAVVIRGLLFNHQIRVLQARALPTSNIPLKSIAVHYSKPLKEFVYDILQDSNNLIANTIYKQMGLAYSNQAGTWHTASKAVRETLATQHGINTQQMVMIDGAGLSHYNLVSPLQISALLNTAYRNNFLNENFIAALAIGGINGTLKHRMNQSELVGRVKAKTGTLRGVSSLSGYVETHNHEIISFSILVNNFAGSIHRYKMLEDRICEIISNL